MLTFTQCTFDVIETHENCVTVDFIYGERIPTGAYDIKYINYNWVEFTLDSNTYLMYAGTHGSCAITKIN